MSHMTPQLDLSLLFMSANCRASYAVTVMAGRRDRASGGGTIDTGSFLRNLFVPSQAQFHRYQVHFVTECHCVPSPA